MNILGVRCFLRGSSGSSRVALTFDDGPHPAHTPRLLDAFRGANARATFFVTGEHARRYPALVREMAGAGHAVGNHSFGHHRALELNEKATIDELERANRVIEDITGRRPHLFRPPFGIPSPRLLRACRTLGLAVIFWSVNARDYRPVTRDHLTQRLFRRISPGAIVVLHDAHYRDDTADRSATVAAVAELLDLLAARNLKPVTVDTLLGI